MDSCAAYIAHRDDITLITAITRAIQTAAHDAGA